MLKKSQYYAPSCSHQNEIFPLRPMLLEHEQRFIVVLHCSGLTITIEFSNNSKKMSIMCSRKNKWALRWSVISTYRYSSVFTWEGSRGLRISRSTSMNGRGTAVAQIKSFLHLRRFWVHVYAHRLTSKVHLYCTHMQLENSPQKARALIG